MTEMRRKTGAARWPAAVLVVAAALVAGAWTDAPSAHARPAAGCVKGNGKTIAIGASLSLSGDFSADGDAFKCGYQLWAKHVNATGGLLGCRV